MKNFLSFILILLPLFLFPQGDSTVIEDEFPERTDSLKVLDESNLMGCPLYDEAPIPLNLDSIKKLIGYPEEAKNANIEGKVVVRVLIDENWEEN